MNTKNAHFLTKQLRSTGAIAAGLASLFLGSFVALHAQVTTTPAEAVTGVTYGTLSNGTDVTVGQINYQNYNLAVTSISTASNTYTTNGPTATSVFIRRVGTTNNNSTVFYDYASYNTANTPDAQVYGNGDSSPTLSEVMLSSNLTQGLRNPFANAASSGSATLLSNIERIDFYFAGGLTVTGNERLIFFDLENPGSTGDGFRIAAITAFNTSSNQPTAYANTGKLVGADAGSPITTPAVASGATTNSTYLRSSTTNGDNLTGTQTIAVIDGNAGDSTELGLVGLVLSFADLGVSVGTTIYGYSLMAGDVNVGNNANNTTRLVNWSNTSTYLNNTDAAGYGNIDFMGFGAQLSNKVVPEPSTYGLIFIGAGVAFFGARKLLKRRASSAA